MKKIKLFFALFAMLALNVGNAWAEKTDTYDFKTNGATKVSGPNAGNVTSSSENVVLTSKTGNTTDTWTISFTSSTYYGYGKNTGVQFGSKSYPPVATMTSKSYNNVSKIEVVTTSGNTAVTLNVKVGSTSFGEKSIGTVTSASQTFEGSPISGEVSVSLTSTNKANFKIEKIIITYDATPSSGGDEGGSTKPAVSVPTFSVPECTFYSSSLDVELSCATDGATIHYTLDGSTPSSTSEIYTSAIAISETTTVKAIAVKDGLTDSEVATATYTKGETVTSYNIDFEKNALEAYVNWDFSNIAIATTTITAKGGTYYGNTCGKASASIKTKEVIQYPGTLTFSVSKETNNNTESSWKVQVSENSSTWTDVKSLSATDMNKGDWKDYSVDLSDYENVYVQISYGGSTAVRAIDEISLAQGVAPVTYTLTIEDPENGTLSVTKGGVPVASGEKFKATTSLVVTPTPNPGYLFESLTVDGTPVDLTEGSYNLTMPASDVTVAATFKANEKPDATLTLSKNGETEDITGYKQDDKVTLPPITSDCVKKFVGWSANANCVTEPEYKANDEYTLTSTTQTLYAVYADVVEGGIVTIKHNVPSDGTTTNMTGNNDAEKFFGLDVNDWSIVSAKNGASNHIGVNKDGTLRLYYHASGGSTLTITAPKDIASIVLNCNSSYKNAWVKVNGSPVTPVDGVYTINAKTFVIGNANTESKQVYIQSIEVTLSSEYSNYSTTCAAALANPTFSLTEGKYTEAKSVEITVTEGTVYYTTDGTTPTASSTKYTGAIALNDCGEYTIKAIAISAESQSDVVSATYTIKLPLTNSQAAPYTEAEAIAVYNGGCYDDQDVYVKGTVKSATYNDTYGNYTITLTNGFQFYRFLQAAETKFTEDIIVTGDVLTACGKLTIHNTTYQLAEGCYLVERIPYEGAKTDISNTEATAYTVDEAFGIIADVSSDLTKEVYVKGLVAVAPTSKPNADGQMTYSISDNGENTGKVLKVYLGLNLNGEAFTSKEDVKLGDYVVVKGKLYNYNGTYELNQGNQLVQHIKAATITIADITMEVEEVKTISATVEPAEAEVTYTIKKNAENAISLSGNTITALAVGTATITATVENGATYMGNSVDFTVTVGPKTEKTDVVILAELGGKWYAMKGAVPSGKSNQLDAIEVTYFNGTLYNVEDKASITWTRSVVDGKATFVNNGKYLKGGTSTDLNLVETVDNNCKWMWNDENGYYTTNTSGQMRTFLYRENYNFRNYTTDKADASDTQGNYSSLPVVTAAKFETAIEIGSGDNSTVIDENVGQTVNVIVDRAFEAGDEWYTLCVPFNMPASVIGTAYQLSGLIQKDADYVEVNLAPKNTIEAGQPYLVQPNVTVNKFVVENVTIVNTTGESIEKSIPGLSVEMQGVINLDGTTDGLYWVGNNGYLYNDSASKLGLRTYFNITTPSGIAPRMRVVAGENVETGVEDLFTTDAPVKVIENGQLIIIRDGVKYNVQGQKL